MTRLIVNFLLLFSIAASAQTMTLNECLNRAVEANPAMKAARTSVRRAEVMQGAAVDIPYTSVTLKQTPVDGGSPDNGIAIGQEFDFPTVYVARHRAAKAETELERRRSEQKLKQLETDVKAAYWQLVHDRKVLELSRQTMETLKKCARLANASFGQGEISKLDVLAMEMAYGQSSYEYAAAERQFNASRRELCQLMNEELHLAIEPSDTLAPLAYPNLDAPTFGATNAGLIADAEVRVAERQVAVEKNAFAPTISVGVTTQMLISGFNPYNIERERFKDGNLMAFEVGVAVPLFFNGQRARMRAAKCDVDLARLRRDEIEIEQKREYVTLADEYSLALDNLKYCTNVEAPNAAEIERLARVSYQNGEIELSDYAEKLSTAAAAQMRYANAVNAFNQAIIKLDYYKLEK